MTATTIDVQHIPPIGRADAEPLAREAYRRLAAAFAAVEGEQWRLPTDCEGWTVRDLAGHVHGSFRAAASVRELISQQLAVRRRPESAVDAMTAEQVERAAGLGTDVLVGELARLADRAARGRARTPGFVRKRTIHVEMGTIDEDWTLGYLNDVILTRDAWMHLIDLHRALGTTPTLDAAHDGRIVGDVVAEWCRRHGESVTLTLDGPAGGIYANGADGAIIELDAVEFCRQVSGRATPTHTLLETEVPF